MSKDAYYFPHDSNARNDEKVIALRIKHSWAGYGLYWAIVEKLRDATDYRLKLDYEVLAYDLRADVDMVRSVITDFGLFAISDDNFFYSESLVERMSVFEKKREQNRIAGKKSAEKRSLGNGCSTDVQRPLNGYSTSKVNKSKVKERKDIGGTGGKRTAFVPPILSEISEYIRTNNYPVDPQQFIDHYTANGWMVGKNKMKDWKAAVRTWKNRSVSATPQPSTVTMPV